MTDDSNTKEGGKDHIHCDSFSLTGKNNNHSVILFA